MGRSPSYRCAKDDDEGINRGAWTANEDKILTEYIKTHGVGQWRSLPKKSGLKRYGKSCRLRWLNYLRPDIKRGNISPEEDELLVRLHRLLGNRWALIAGRLPGRTDNEIKNYWITHLSKKVQLGEFDPSSQRNFERRNSPSYSDYKGEKVVDKDDYKGRNAQAVETIAARLCGRVTVDVQNQDSYSSDVLDILVGTNQGEKMEFKAADNHVAQTDISKSWCQLLLEDCMGDYQYDQLELINGLQTDRSHDHLLESSFLFPCRSKLFQEIHYSTSCNLVDNALPHSEHFNSTCLESLMELGEFSSLLP